MMCSKVEAREAMEARSKAIDSFLEVCTEGAEDFPAMLIPADCVGVPLRSLYQSIVCEGLTAPFRDLLARLR